MSDISKTMKAWQLHAFGLENLKLSEVPTPVPLADEILIRVGAVSLNFRDKAIVDGIYGQPIPMPLIPVSDVAGTVIQIGAAVKRFKIGDRVISTLYSKWIDGQPAPDEPDYCYGAPLPGGLAEYMVINDNSAVLAPESYSDEEASTLPIAAVTAWFSLVETGKIKPGDTVVAQGTGGVSIFATQMAKAIGARVIITTSSDVKGEKARSLGADDVINYVKTPDWAAEVLKLTNGLGADHLLDVVGGDGINDSVRATRVGGQVSMIGFLGGQATNLNLTQAIFKQTKLQGICVGHRKSFEEMNAALTKFNIKPEIEAVYNFEDAVKAYEHVSRGAFGKIVIRLS